MNPIDIPPFDAQGALTNPVRSLGGVNQSGSVVVGTDYGVQATWLYIGVTGNITVKKWDGTTQVYSNIAAGVYHPIHSIAITAATATNMVWGN